MVAKQIVKVTKVLGSVARHAEETQSAVHDAILNAILGDGEITRRISKLSELYEGTENDPATVLPVTYWIAVFEAFLIAHNHGLTNLCEYLGKRRYNFGFSLIPIVVVSALRAGVTLEELFRFDTPEDLLDPTKIGSLALFCANASMHQASKVPDAVQHHLSPALRTYLLHPDGRTRGIAILRGMDGAAIGEGGAIFFQELFFGLFRLLDPNDQLRAVTVGYAKSE